MKIAILGTRGVPNHHGGFEQFAEFFSVYLQSKGIDTHVYCSSLHPFKEETYNGVKRIVCYDPENKIGTAGQFIYDLNCILDARKKKFDVILQLGYTSSSIWHFLMPKKALIITNMDGLEWKRTKYNKLVQYFLQKAEALAANKSDYLISDSIGIQEYIEKKYNKKSEFIAYGAEIFTSPNFLKIKHLVEIPFEYDLLIARMEPENNIETILKGYIKGVTNRKLYLIGNQFGTKFGKQLVEKYGNNEKIIFLGAIYDLEILNNLRYFSNLYFHGHSVGGTNPSLLEAMASNCCIVAHNNVFNKTVLNSDAFYFTDHKDISDLLTLKKEENKIQLMIKNNLQKIEKKYNWEIINNSYQQFIEKCLKMSK